MFYKRLCDQWECEADDAIAEQERLQGRPFTEKQKEVFRKRGAHRFNIPEGAHWDDVLKLQQILVMFSQARCVRSPTRMP